MTAPDEKFRKKTREKNLGMENICRIFYIRFNSNLTRKKCNENGAKTFDAEMNEIF